MPERFRTVPSNQSMEGAERFRTVPWLSLLRNGSERFRTVPALIVRCLGRLQIPAGTVLNGSVLIVGTVQNCSAATLEASTRLKEARD